MTENELGQSCGQMMHMMHRMSYSLRAACNSACGICNYFQRSLKDAGFARSNTSSYWLFIVNISLSEI